MMCILLSTVTAMWAQDDKAVQLEGVKVEAARIVSRPDGRLIVPTQAQREGSTNAYSLLAKLPLPRIRVDAVLHTITPLDNRGAVQLRIDGRLATQSEYLALDPKAVRSIVFIDNPGVRYGEEIGYVIDIKTVRSSSGYDVGVDLTHTATTRHGSDMAFAKLNSGKSELGLTYVFNYSDLRDERMTDRVDYLLADGSLAQVLRSDEAMRQRNFSNLVDLRYNVADSDRFVFQAALSGDFHHTPGDFTRRRVVDQGVESIAFQRNHEVSVQPTLDLYLFRQMGSHQNITANMVGTHIATDAYNYSDEGAPYAYTVDGSTWSVTAEGIYENRLRPLTLSFGSKYSLKYTLNGYSGDVWARNAMHNSSLYLFAEAKGRWQKLGYVAGVGLTNLRYHQGMHRYDFWYLRPKGTLSYSFTDALSASYSIELRPRVSRIAMVSDARIRSNRWEWMVGNPDVEPSRVLEHVLRVNYNVPLVSTELMALYRKDMNCNMGVYERTVDNQFLYRQRTDNELRMWFVDNRTTVNIIPEHLVISANIGLYRFYNYGHTFKHHLTTCNFGGGIQAYWGRWSFTANADNGWNFLEGERHGKDGGATYLTCSYQLGNCTLSAYWQHPLENRPIMYETEVLNQYVHRHSIDRNGDYGNMLTLSFSWKLSHGRRYKGIRKKMENKDTETGIM